MAAPIKKKKKKPKGKLLSETLRAKDEAKARSDADLEVEQDDEADDSDLDDGDEDERDSDDDLDESSGDRDDSDDEDGDDDEEDDDDDDDDEPSASTMGHQRYVIGGFIGAWLVAAYILSRALETVWSRLATTARFIDLAPRIAAVPHEGELISRASISFVLGAIVAGLLALRYYVKPDIRKWADEVAEEIGKVKWPTRKEIGNYTVIVIAASAVLTAYLALLDRFWAFVTNLIYSSGA